MAGLAALMTRKKRDRRRELELSQHLRDTGSLPELTGKEAQAALQAKAAHETIKKMLIGKELLHQKSKASFDALSQVSYNDNEDGSSKNGFSNAYSAIYIGLILMCIGAVITFVGLGDKGFKTLELKLIGPILSLIGFTCITVKIIHCTFPQLFQYPSFLKKRKLKDEKDSSNLMEKGKTKEAQITRQNGKSPNGQNGNGQLSDQSTKNSPQFVSPRVTLQSSKRVNRPKSTIPNYIEDSSEDEDDFDRGKSRPHSNRYNSVNAGGAAANNQSYQFETHHSHHNQQNTDEGNNKTNLQSSDLKQSQKSSTHQQHEQQQQVVQMQVQQKPNEIVLTPNALKL